MSCPTASCAIHRGLVDDYVQLSTPSSSAPINLAKPRLERSNMSHVAVSSISSKNDSRRSKKKSGITQKVFNPQAARPQPTLTTPYQEHVVTMCAASTLVNTSTSIPTYASATFTLGGLSAVSEYTALFDEYKIDQIEVWLTPTILMSSSVGSAPMCVAVDLDDANTPASYVDVCARQDSSQGQTGDGFYFKWKPYAACALYSGAFTSYGSLPSPWIDCASPNVQHYGIKLATNSADGQVRGYSMITRALVRFRGAAI